MQLARVIGTVVATIKHPALQGIKIMMIQPLSEDLKPVGEPLAAVESEYTHSGPNDLVHWTVSRESCYVLPDWFAPVDAAITGIVDDVNVVDVGIKDKEVVFDFNAR